MRAPLNKILVSKDCPKPCWPVWRDGRQASTPDINNTAWVAVAPSKLGQLRGTAGVVDVGVGEHNGGHVRGPGTDL